MKNLIFKNELFYLADDDSKPNGQTKSVSGYNLKTISKTNMPHQYFNKNSGFLGPEFSMTFLTIQPLYIIYI